jgi:hypothetical protein
MDVCMMLGMGGARYVDTMGHSSAIFVEKWEGRAFSVWAGICAPCMGQDVGWAGAPGACAVHCAWCLAGLPGFVRWRTNWLNLFVCGAIFGGFGA